MPILLPEGKQSFTNALGLPLIGGKLYTYAAGTNTPLPTYSDAAGTTPNTNPVVLDGRGEATIFWNGAYKVVLRDALGVLIWTVDNITSVDPLDSIVAGLSTFSAPGSTTPRALALKLGDFVSVKDFGAKGNGVADDTATIRAAVLVTPCIYFPPGTYMVSDEIRIPSNRHLFGAGRGVSIIKNVGGRQKRPLRNADDAGNDRITIEDLTVDGSTADPLGTWTPTADAIYLTRCTNSAVRRVEVINTSNDGIIIEYGRGNEVSGCLTRGCTKQGIYASGTDDITVNDNTSIGCYGGLALAATWGFGGAGNISRGGVFGLTMARDTRYGDIGYSAYGANITGLNIAAETLGAQTLHGNTYTGTRNYGASFIKVTGTFGGKVLANMLYDSTLDVVVAESQGQGALFQGSSRNTIRGRLNSWGLATGVWPGIQFLPYDFGDGLLPCDDNDYGGLTLYDPSASQVPVSDGGQRNVGFGLRIMGLSSDQFYYAPGDWTPTLAGDGTAGAFTYATRTGRVTRVGKMVTVSFRIILSAITTPPAGNIWITGLPYPVKGGASTQFALGEVVANLGGVVKSVGGNAMTSRIQLIGNGDNTPATNLTEANVIATSRFSGMFTYETD